ncbi:hypothetical protein OG741_18250 [Streptomyces sp. NBC_01410]|uniref:hypothetical protein n=1 Tax=Streptomyces sp. NBC_01410 TaxID=2903856 RepID=UPI0032435FCB
MYELQFPDYLSGYEAETEAKGYLVGVRVVQNDSAYELTIYDTARLKQEVADEMTGVGYFAAANLIVVPRVTREDISRAVEGMSRGNFSGLVPATLT